MEYEVSTLTTWFGISASIVLWCCLYLIGVIMEHRDRVRKAREDAISDEVITLILGKWIALKSHTVRNVVVEL